MSAFAASNAGASALNLDESIPTYLDSVAELIDADEVFLLVSWCNGGKAARDYVEAKLGWRVVQVYAQKVIGKPHYVARTDYYEFVEQKEEIDPLTQYCLDTAGRDRVIGLRDTPNWNSHWHTTEYMNQLGFSDRINTVKHLNPSTEIYTVVSRGVDRESFSAEDKNRLRAALNIAQRLYSLVALSFGIHTNSSTLLTPRERDVLNCILAGDSDKEAAVKLEITASTLRSYVKDIYRKFQVRNRGELLKLWL